MIHRLPVIGAIFAGLIVLGLSLAAVVNRVPAYLEDGNTLRLTVRTVEENAPLIDPVLMTVIIVVLALAGLTVLFVVEYLTPRTARRASRGRLRAVEDMIGDLDARRS